MGISFLYPLKTLRPNEMREAVEKLCDPENEYKRRTVELTEEMEREGGKDLCVSTITRLARAGGVNE